MEKLKEYKWFILISIIVIGGFYWNEIRPSQIKKECAIVQPPKVSQRLVDDVETNCKNTEEKSAECVIKEALLREAKWGVRAASDIEYSQCLRKNGL